jgi:hypothetical protein
MEQTGEGETSASLVVQQLQPVQAGWCSGIVSLASFCTHQHDNPLKESHKLAGVQAVLQW